MSCIWGDIFTQPQQQSSSCCGGDRDRPKKEVMLLFCTEELVYDAANYSYVEGELLPEVEGEHRRHQVIDIAQDGNRDRVTRVLDVAHAECVEMLYPYTKQEIEDDGWMEDDPLWEKPHYQIDMLVPADFSMTTVQLLEKLIHEYLVCRVVADWMSITNPEKEETWEKKFTLLREKICSCKNSRTGRARIKLQPF